MISRRNIRIKVMQSLYTVATMDTLQTDESKAKCVNILNEKLNRSLDLFVTTILYILKVAQYAERNAQLNQSKLIPTDDELQNNTKIAGNLFLWQILSNETFTEKVKSNHLEEQVNEDWIKKIFQQLQQSDLYKTYIKKKDRELKYDKKIMLFIWEQLMLKNEDLLEHFSDDLNGWDDDKDMIFMLVENFFKHNSTYNYLQLVSEEKLEYAQNLIRAVIEKDSIFQGIIEPKLRNWDPERVALIDTILLKMGICEFLYFPTIPTKVTINEYIEIAKVYSTPQSGQFVNGVLDNICKGFEAENKIRKTAHFKK
ncbi:MAG: transcription antitermination factor NusB [Chitinophagia bacterium]|jgi:transcription antitermination protein NusB|nr:transcription antitermination factor NusB [Chitinophagia bacterium]